MFVKTIKKDGSVVDGDLAGAFDTSPFQEPLAPVFDDTKYRTILPPNVETGDSVEYEIVEHVRKWPKAGDFWLVHYLTTDIPTLSETVILDLPADRKVAFYESATVSGRTEIANGRRIERWMSVNSDPATATDSAAPLFAVSSVSSWDAFGEWVRSLNEPSAEPTPEIKTLAAKLIANKSTEQEQIAALYGYVATKIRYVGISFGLGRLQPHTAARVLHNAYGDCKDQTALLSALLKAAGFRAYSVLTTPGAGVAVPGVPEFEQFNHEFTAVDTKSGLMFLDTTMGPVQPGLLQPGVRGHSALLIGDKTSSVVDIPLHSPVPERVATTLTGKVTSAGAFEGSARLEFQGFAEPVLRRIFLDATDAEKEKILQKLAGPEFGNAHVRQMSSADPSDLTKPFWVQFELSDKNFFSQAKTSMEIKLDWPASLAALLEAKNPQKSTPIDSASITRSMDLIVDTTLLIANGMPVHSKTPFGSMDSEFSYLSGHLMLKRSFQLNGGVIAPSDWKEFVSFMRSAEDATARGFTLERHSPARSSTSAQLSSSALAMREASQAFDRRDYEAAKRSYLEVVRLEPQSPVAWNNLGRTYSALHDYSGAEQAYKRQIEINPEDAYAYNNLGLLYQSLSRQDDAIASFQKQIALNSRDRFAHFNLSNSFWATRQWEQARQEAIIAAEISPEAATRWVQLGKTQIKTQHIQEARDSFERALAQGHDALAENNIAYELADAGIDLDKAWKLVASALDSDRDVCQPESLAKDDQCSTQLRRISTRLDTAGWVLYRQGNLAEALPYLLSAYAITARTEVELHLSMALAKSGRLDEALKHYADAHARADFSRFDSGEARGELVRAVAGEAVLDSRLEQLQIKPAPSEFTPRVIALVDEHGKVVEAQSADPRTPDSLVSEAKSLTLEPLSWPAHSIRSIRTIEFRRDGAQWSPTRSYVGQAPEPQSGR